MRIEYLIERYRHEIEYLKRQDASREPTVSQLEELLNAVAVLRAMMLDSPRRTRDEFWTDESINEEFDEYANGI